MKNKLRHYFDGHVGDVIIFLAFFSALVCYTLTVLRDKPDTTLGIVVGGALSGLLGYMTKCGPAQTNVEKLTVEGDSDPDKTPRV